MRRANLVTLPVHRDGVATCLHDPVQTDVPDAAHWIARDDHREGDVRATVLGPAFHQREPAEIDLLIAPDDLLACWRAARFSRRELGYLHQARKQRQLRDETIRDLHLKQFRDAVPDLVQIIDAERHAHPAHRAKEVDPDREIGTASIEKQRVLEQKRRPPAGQLHGAIGNLTELEVDRDGLPDANKLAAVVERMNEISERVERHSVSL
jgi:hypothetical protein